MRKTDSFTVKIVLLLVVMLSVLIPSTLNALTFDLPGIGETRFEVTESAIYRLYKNDDYIDQYEEGKDSEYLNRLNVNIINGDYLLGFRFDIDIDTPREEEYRLEKKFFQVNKDAFTLEIGDYYYALGRGLVFSVVKLFEDDGLEYQIEQTVLGGRFSLRGETVSGTILAGVLEDTELDIRDTIGGGSIGWQASEILNLGMNVIGITFDEDDPRNTFEPYEDGIIGSISIEFPLLADVIGFYLEGSGLMLQAREDDQDDLSGWGLYAESSLYLGNWTMSFEGRRYQDFLFPYHSPPLLEPEELSILADQFDIDTVDITGFRARVDYRIPSTQTLIYGVCGYTDDSPEEDAVFGNYYRYITQSYLGIDSHLSESDIHILSAIGYRHENGSELSPSDYRGYTPHAFFHINVPLAERHSIEVGASYKKFTEDAAIGFSDYSFTRQEYSLGWLWSPLLSITATYEYFDDYRSRVIGLDPDKKDFSSINLTVRPIEDLYLKFYYGSTPGGVKCSGGVCKSFPSFEGFRAEVVFRL